MEKTLNEYFKKSFLEHKECNAIHFLKNGKIETELKYGQLHEDSNKIANMLLDSGIKKGDRIAFYVPKSLILISSHIAVQKIGAISVHLNPGYKESEMDYLLNDALPSIVFCEDDNKKTIQKLCPESKIIVIEHDEPYQQIEFFKNFSNDDPKIRIYPNDPSLIIYTSGTTGKAKGAVLTHNNLVNDAENIIKIWKISSNDVLCHALPLFHIHGLCFALHTSLLAGAQVVMLDIFSPEIIVNTLGNRIDKITCTVFMAVPAMYTKMIDYINGTKNIFNFENIRLLTSGSAPLLPRDFERICKAFGKEPVEREGMSETGMNFSNPLNGLKKPGSIGLPLPNVQVRIVDPETEKDVKCGETGEFWLKGLSITPGYWQKNEESKKAFSKQWFKTGDLGYFDDDGYYFLTDRLKHIIISGGENISPKEVENVINQFDGILESSVVGIADEKWGEKIVAAVVKDAESTCSEIEVQNFCKKFLHDWKCPKIIIFVEKLPRNKMGKLLKEEVKLLFAKSIE